MFYQIRVLASVCVAAAALSAQPAPETVRVAAGPFQMGSAEGATWERPVHQVTLSAFSIGKRPVTFAEFRAFRPAHPNPPNAPQDADVSAQPVTGVSWNDARSYCRWLSEQTGKRYRLPTEAEWEKAVRGGLEGKPYPWGDEPPVPKDKAGDPDYEIPEKANPWGIFAGTYGVWEWVVDGYSSDYYRKSPDTDPQGPEGARYRVLRGGNYRSDPNSMRCANRGSARPGTVSDAITFRVALQGAEPVQVSESRPEPKAPSTPAPPPTKPAQPPATQVKPTSSGGPVSVTAISVETQSGQVVVTIAASVQTEYTTMVLGSPDRLVIDIPQGMLKAPTTHRRINVAALGVHRVRAAQFNNDPLIARIVVDMESRLDFDIATEANRLIVRLQATE